jgi:hypothetical protein
LGAFHPSTVLRPTKIAAQSPITARIDHSESPFWTIACADWDARTIHVTSAAAPTAWRACRRSFALCAHKRTGTDT